VSAAGDVTSSLVAHGSRVEGTVRRSIVFPGVHIGPGAVVEDSIVMHDARILPGAEVRRAIVDKQVRVGEGATIGIGERVKHREHPHDLSSGLTVIGKRAEIPAGARIGTNTMIEIGARESDFVRHDVPPGSTVRPQGRGAR
jgi:glucose-1-phosphate adenylyltransferase